MLRGFLAKVCEQDRDTAQYLLDSAFDQPALLVFLPELHLAMELDAQGVERLKRALSAGQVPVSKYRLFALIRGATENISGAILKDLLLLLADQPEGFDVAMEILHMRIVGSAGLAHQECDLDLLEVGRELLQRVTFRGNHQLDQELADVVNVCLAGSDAAPIAASIAVRLRRAMAAHETHSWDNDHLLTALLKLHPAAVMDGFFIGDERDQKEVARAFSHLPDLQRNPVDVISSETLIAWCDGDPVFRYPFAASFITFANGGDSESPLVWSEQAMALLANAPEPKSVLAELIERFQPVIWSGSRARLMEANVRLLDSLESHVPSDLMPFVVEAKAQFAQKVAQERQYEAKLDRVWDKRFE